MEDIVPELVASTSVDGLIPEVPGESEINLTSVSQAYVLHNK